MAVRGEEFIVPIGVDDKVSPAFNRMSKTSQKLIKTFTAVGNANVRLNQTFELIGRVQRQIQAAIGATIGEYARYERALIGVGKTTNIAGTELENLGDEFQKLSERIPTTTNQLLGLGQTAGQLGVTGADNILKFSETMALLATASDLAGQTGATAVARILNITEGGVDNIDRFAASIVGLGNQFAATESEIAKVATSVARSTAAFKVGSADVAGLSTAIRALGIQAQIGGSVVGKAFRTIDAAIRDGGDSLATLEQITGMTGSQLRETFQEDATAVFTSFIEGLGRIQAGGGSVAKALSLLELQGDEVNKVLPVLAQRASLVGEALGVANQEFERNTALVDEAEKANKTLGAEWQKLRNVVRNAASDMSSTVAPALTRIIRSIRESMIEALDDARRGWARFAKAMESVDFDELAKSVKNLAIASASLIAVWKISSVLSAIKAVGGFAAAIQLMGGLPVILAKVRVAMLGLAAASLKASAAFLKFTGATIGIAGLVFAIDILIRNIEKLGKIGDIIANAINALGRTLEIQASKFGVMVAEWIADITEHLEGVEVAGFTLVDEEDVVAARERVIKALDKQEELIKDRRKLSQAIEEDVSDIDTGILGQVIDFGKELRDLIGDMSETAKEGADDIKDATDKLEKTGPKIKLPQLFSEEDIQLIKATFGESAGMIASAATAMLEVPLAFIEAANQILDAIQGLIDAIPALLNKVAGIFNSLTDLPNAISAGVQNVLDSVINFIKNFIPNVIKAIGDVLSSIADFLVDALPNAVSTLAERIPQFLIQLVERLPEIAFKFGEALIKASPAALAIRFTTELIKQLPRFVVALIKEIPAMAVAFVEGVIVGLKGFVNDIAGFLGLGEIFDLGSIKEGVKEIGDQVTRAASNLFQVIDLEAQARGLDVADRIRSAINSSINRLGNVWDLLLRALRDAWNWIWENILQPIGELVATAWQWVVDNVLLPIKDFVQDAFQWVVDKILNPLSGIVSGAFQWVVDKILDPLSNVVATAFQWVIDKILTPLSDVVSDAFSGVKNFLKTFSFPKIKTPGWLQDFIDAVDALTNWKFPPFNAGGLVGAQDGKTSTAGIEGVASISGGSDGVSANVGGSSGITVSTSGTSIGGRQLFNNGGPVLDLDTFRKAARVQGVKYFQTGGESRGTDTVPAMLTPGEFVVNRESTRQNLGLLQFINSQKTGTVAPVQGNTTVSVVVHTKTELTPDQIRREVVPEMKKQLKRASQDGAFVIDQKGIRS